MQTQSDPDVLIASDAIMLCLRKDITVCYREYQNNNVNHSIVIPQKAHLGKE